MEVTPIERGWVVYTEDNKRVGDVVEVHPHYLLVSRGLLVVRDIYVPRYAVGAVEDRKVHLAIPEERLRRMGWTAPPPPPPDPVDSTVPRLVLPVAGDDAATSPFDMAGDGTETSDMAPALDRPDGDGDAVALPGDSFAESYGVYEPDATGFDDDYDYDYEDMGVFFGTSVEVDGEAYLAVRRLGDGPPVVFIHGWGFDRRVWDYLTLDLPADYTVVTYDGRGYGGSTAPWTAYTVEQAARDLRVLLRTLDLRDATLVGLDLGAATALHYVLNGGRRAGRLVLIAPAVLIADGEPTVRQEPLWAWRDELRRDRPRLAAELARAWAPVASAETQAWLRDGLLDAAPHALLRAVGALAMPDIQGLPAAVALPTRILCGREDPLVPLARARELAESIPGATLIELDVPGHLPMLADPERMTAEIRAAITST